MNRSVRYRRTRLNSSFHLWQDEPSNTGVYIRVSAIASATKQVASLSIKTAVNEAKTELGSDEITIREPLYVFAVNNFNGHYDRTK